MQILVTPEDLIRRCVWDNYVYYIVGSEKEAEKLLKENSVFEISERDALVIGLLKVIETDNLIFKFNTHIVEILSNKSAKEKELLLMRKRTFDTAVDKFLDKFPFLKSSFKLFSISKLSKGCTSLGSDFKLYR